MKFLMKMMGIAAVLVSAGCAAGSGEEPADREMIFQAALLQNLTQGDYHGSISVKELKKLGDTGIGTFDNLNGELVMCSGTVYRCAGDGTVEIVSDDETVPFCTITFLDTDREETLANLPDFQSLLDLLDERVKELGENYFYMVRIDGFFPEMHVRSEYAQQEPFLPLAEVLKTDQTFYDYEEIGGTLIGLYCPVFASGFNTPGWHFHFVSEDHTAGGHVVGLSLREGKLKMDLTPGFKMVLPSTEEFRNFDFSRDQSEDIEEVEKPKQ